VTVADNSADPLDSSGKTLREWIPDIYGKAYERGHAMLARWWGVERPDTASLIDRAVCKLLQCAGTRCASRQHALNILAQTMRWVLMDILKSVGARPLSEHRASRRGPRALSLEIVPEPSQAQDDSFRSLHEALERLDAISPRLRQVIELRFLVGLTIDETARELRVSTTSVTNDTKLAKAWLFSELNGPGPSENPSRA
jgi:hypothetical protein